MTIDSPAQQQGWFGYSVEHLGDINRDGYEDVAISAPYADNGKGVVYIYRGSEEGLILSQVPTNTFVKGSSSSPIGNRVYGRRYERIWFSISRWNRYR